MKCTRFAVVSSVLVGMLMLASQAADAQQPAYEIGFSWDWRVDFGMPTNVSQAPPNPQSDAGSRSLAGNAGRSAGMVAQDVWAYGKIPYALVAAGTVEPADFVLFTTPIAWEGGVLWNDSSSPHFNWDVVGWTPASGHFANPGGDSEHTTGTIRFRYPGARHNAVRMSGTIRDCSVDGNDGADWYIMHETAERGITLLDSGILGDLGAVDVELTADVAVGDALYLAVGYGPDQSCGGDSLQFDVLFQVIPGMDCNGNGLDDSCDLACGVTAGPCDVLGCGRSFDCNLNRVPDECDIGEGLSIDCDEDARPDDCEPDSDGDGIADDCDRFADFDHDADFDLDDYSALELCHAVSGPGTVPLFDECLAVFDSDGSDSVDMRDVAHFVNRFTGRLR